MPTILVVDDETCVLIHEAVLKSAGFSVITSRDSDDALGYLRRGTQVDAVITDIVRPGQMDGIEFLRRVREIAPEAVRIIISGTGLASRFEEASQLAHVVMGKPTPPKEVVRVLNERLRERMVQSG